MTFDREILLRSWRRAFGPIRTPAQIAGIGKLLDFIEADPEWMDLRHVAYLLATVKHECADRWHPIAEYADGWDYDLSRNPKKAAGLGNAEPGDGPRFKGAGFVQLTGRRNFALFSRLLGVDLVSEPELALDPATSYRIAALGMRQGLFTGVALSRFINAAGCDYIRARKVINGLDRAELIAGYADKFQGVLREALTT